MVVKVFRLARRRVAGRLRALSWRARLRIHRHNYLILFEVNEVSSDRRPESEYSLEITIQSIGCHLSYRHPRLLSLEYKVNSQVSNHETETQFRWDLLSQQISRDERSKYKKNTESRYSDKRYQESSQRSFNVQEKGQERSVTELRRAED